jgi:hypothetical protein
MQHRPAEWLIRARGLLSSSLLMASLFACAADPVDWGDVQYRRSMLGDPDTRSSIADQNLPRDPTAIAACRMSIRTAADGGEMFRAWWSVRADSSVVLWAQRSLDGGASWQPAVQSDARDHGGRGCARPAPSIFYDRAHRYLYLVYFIEPNDGAGVFFVHSMDDGATFHAPVPIVYGNRPSAASVAANGDSVAVVFEDPNATAPQIGVALSRTTGHIFEERGEATPDDVRAVAPWVSLDHRKITVSWKDASTEGGAAPSDRVGYREGTWK